jgi:intraflagellar transport protein 52
MKKGNLVIIGGPRDYFNHGEIETMKNYLEEGGNLLVFLGEGGEERNNTNLNELLIEYGIKINSDNVVRTSYYKYLHPKECYIDDAKVHPELLNSLKNIPKKKKIELNDDMLDEDYKEDDRNLKIVYPYGASLEVDKGVAVLFSSGIIAYPHGRPLAAVVQSKSMKGKMVVFGSERFFDDEFFEKEENKKVTDYVLKYLLGIWKGNLEKNVKETVCEKYTYTPNIVALSEKLKSCLEDIKEPPKHFNDLFDTTLFKIDNNLVPEAFALYEQLNVKQENIGIIPPQFETPLPPLQLAVFDPIIRDFPNPGLELFDLDEQFASEK